MWGKREMGVLSQVWSSVSSTQLVSTLSSCSIHTLTRHTFTHGDLTHDCKHNQPTTIISEGKISYKFYTFVLTLLSIYVYLSVGIGRTRGRRGVMKKKTFGGQGGVKGSSVSWPPATSNPVLLPSSHFPADHTLPPLCLRHSLCSSFSLRAQMDISWADLDSRQ